jgi:hypothetical protein
MKRSRKFGPAVAYFAGLAAMYAGIFYVNVGLLPGVCLFGSGLVSYLGGMALSKER